MENLTLEQNKEWLKRYLYGYSEGVFKDRFPAMILTDQAKMKMGQVLMYLCLREDLIQGFFERLDRLHSRDTTMYQSAHGTRHPAFNKITKLGDDGTLLGFSFMWMNLVPNEVDLTGLRFERLDIWQDPYTYSMNGGLIFNGEIGKHATNSWGIHT